MKKLITFLSIIFCFNSKAQFVIIPDTGFVNWLQTYMPSAMNGNQMDTTNSSVTTCTLAIFISPTVKNLFGIQYFSSLQQLEAHNYQLTTIPALPNSLQVLLCSGASLNGLPSLPNSLKYIDCSNNGSHLTNLPPLPNSLETLICTGDSLTTLPTLPNSLKSLYCSGISNLSIPQLPSSLDTLFCDGNSLTNLPVLPDSLICLSCSNNYLTTLQTLPNTLKILRCDNNNITCFPTFPDSLNYYFSITNNPFTCLPNYIPLMDSLTLTYPLCAAGNINGCPITDTCPPYQTFILNKDTLQPNTWNAYPNYSSNVASAKWYWGDGTSSMGLYPGHTYSNAAWYNICVTAYSFCGDSLSYCQNDSLYRANNTMVSVNVVNISTDIKQNFKDNYQISVVPNPTTGKFILEANDFDASSLDMFDMNGRQVFNQRIEGNTNIDATNLEAGIYTLVVKSGSGIINKKLVIIR